MKTSILLQKSSRTRQFIIEKSAALFNMKGVSGTSLSDIIKVTGLTKGSIYGNFKDKDEVAIAVFEYNVTNMLQKLFKIIEGFDNTVEKLLQYPRYFREECEKIFYNGGCAIMNTAVEADDSHPALKEIVASTIKMWETNLVNTISQGVIRNEIKKEVNPEKYAIIFIAAFEGGVMLSKVTGQMKYIFNTLDHLEELILKELKNDNN